MSNVLSEEKKQQVIALGKLGWSLRRIEQATGVRRETAGAYLKAAGIAVRPPGAWGRRAPAKPANEVTTDSGAAKPANEVTTDFDASGFSHQSGNRPQNRDRRHQCLRSRTANVNRAGAESWPECHGHLAGPRFRSRLYRWLSDREAFRSQAARTRNPGSRGRSSSPHREKKHRSITASARWCAIRRAGNIVGRDCS